MVKIDFHIYKIEQTIYKSCRNTHIQISGETQVNYLHIRESRDEQRPQTWHWEYLTHIPPPLKIYIPTKSFMSPVREQTLHPAVIFPPLLRVLVGCWSYTKTRAETKMRRQAVLIMQQPTSSHLEIRNTSSDVRTEDDKVWVQLPLMTGHGTVTPALKRLDTNMSR